MVFEDLKNILADSPSNENRFNEIELDELIDYIVNTHHSYVLDALPAILTRTRKVETVYGERNPEVIRIADRFEIVAGELQNHTMKEERILFPYIKSLVRSKKSKIVMSRPQYGSVENSIKMLEAEHQFAGNEMYEISSLSSSYLPPADACTTFKVSYLELQQFELDLRNHIHLENNILFSKSITLVQQVFSA